MKIRKIIITFTVLLSAAIFADAEASKNLNAYGQKHYTVESAHFRIHYHRGLGHLVPRVADKLEQLYQIYVETYHIVLPQKTDVVLYESEIPDAFAFPYFNFIYIGTHDYEFNLRGSSDWFDDVITHEYAHIVSIQTGMKFPPAIPGIQAGFFTHPNAAARFEGLHILPSETMPIWLLEGVAQYESSRRGADKWDTHRDMIMRTRTLSGNLLSWPHMQAFSGRGDDFEMAYNHGFSLVMYISETYGYDKITAIMRENARITRLSFDGTIKSVLGISAKQLYNDWTEELNRRYTAQIRTIGDQVYGRRINKDGFDNGHPKFSPDGGKIYFLSNAKHDYFFRELYSYNLSDTVDEKKKIKFEMPISGNYDIHKASGKIAFVSMKSRKSVQKPRMGGQRTFDLFIDELPPDKPKFFGKKTERQITQRKSVFAASFSPDGDKVAAAVRKFDRFFLAIVDTAGKDIRVVYPEVSSADEFFNGTTLPPNSDGVSFSSIFSLAWSPNGKEIAVDYIDGTNRKIGLYDTLTKKFTVIMDAEHDQRNPSFNKDGSALYFSSDKSGIFNIYRYIFETGALEQLTNVSGGAFHPAVSADEKKLAYSNYDKNGYSIYLIDSIVPLRSTDMPREEALTERAVNATRSYSTPLSNRRDYSFLPRQMLVAPTIIAEQVITADNDENKGITHLKGGVVLDLMDPLAWSGVGNELSAFFLVDLRRILNFVGLEKGYASYDAGFYGTSKMLPVTIDGSVTVRGIAGEDWFFDESEDMMVMRPYRILLTNALLGASHPLVSRVINGQIFLGHDRYDVALDLSDDGYGIFPYNLSKGVRIGAMTYLQGRARNSRSNISPTGIAAKLQYNLWQQRSLKEENSFAVESSLMKEQYDDYLFHQIDGRLLLGIPSLIYPKHDVHVSMRGSYLKPIGNQDIPSFFLPAAILPGYSFFYKDEKKRIEFGDTSIIRYDTLLITGKAVLTGEFSYRFPLWPRSIDRKLGFVYFDKLYGALNVSAGAGFDTPKNALNWNRSDWLLSYGAELRLETISFNNYPLALKFRYDYGADRAAPETFVDNREITLGGHRFAMSIGFTFDDWGMIPVVDYFAPARLKASPSIRR